MSRLWILAALILVAIGVTACGDGSGEEGSATTAESAAAFPVTIPHAFGETTIEEAPERVVTLGWGSTDAAIALGTVPVAIPFESYGADEDGVLPWIRQALEDRGEPIPTVLPDSPDDPPYEEIAAAEPDVILAPLSGITKKQYELLSQIAPTVAYPGEPWVTPWQEVIEIVGSALGASEQADALLAGIDAQLAEQAAAHPELAGKTVAMVWDADGTFYVYKSADARVAATEALGLVSAPSVEELAEGDESFYYTLSYEKLDRLTSDILVSFADSEELSDRFLSSAPAKTMSQVREDRVAEVIGPEFVASVSPPTALSLTWGLDEYTDILADAARRADAAE